MTTRWTRDDVPDLHGRRAVVTGANTGLGLEASVLLAQRGAAVVMACRDPRRAADAAARVRDLAPRADVTTLGLDLGSLGSVRRAADELTGRHDGIDLLVNNAGMLGTAERTETEDGLEATFATNHLGVFALTGLLLPLLLPVTGSRVVTMSSITSTRARLDLGDLQARTSYRRNSAYSRSKLANLLFALELDERLARSGSQTASLAAHPGQSRTDFTRGLNVVGRFIYSDRARWLTGSVMQDKSVGVLAGIRAATDADAAGGTYFGPSGRGELTGYPVAVSSNAQSRDPEARRRLWEESERLTGVRYAVS